VTGSSYVAIVVPIMAFIMMAFWLGLVFYADSHPGYGRGRSRKSAQTAAPHAVATQLPTDDLGELSPSADTPDAAAASRELEPVGGRS
jgi:hypothetical protein